MMTVMWRKIALGIFLAMLIPLSFLFFNKKLIASEHVITVETKHETIEDRIDIRTDIKEADYFTIHTEYPITSIDLIDDRTKAWVEAQEVSFSKEVEPVSFFNSKEITSHLRINTEVTKATEDLYSFVLEARHEHKDKTDIYIHTFVVNKREESLLKLDDLLHLQTIEHETILSEAIFNADTTKGLSRETIHDTTLNMTDINWSLEEKHLILYIYENKKPITIQLNHQTIKPLLQTQYEHTFIPKKKTKTKKSKKAKKHKKLVALTFDDGPDKEVTPQILDTLDKHKVKATFFVLANNVIHNPELAKQIIAKDHEIGNHSKSHKNLSHVKQATIEYELLQSQEDIKSITGVKTKLFRPPYGEYNESIMKLASKSNQDIIMWSVDSKDWKHLNQDKIMTEVKSQIQPNSIILLHDIHQPTADTLDELITYLKISNYELVTVSELINEIEPAVNDVYYGK